MAYFFIALYFVSRKESKLGFEKNIILTKKRQPFRYTKFIVSLSLRYNYTLIYTAIHAIFLMNKEKKNTQKTVNSGTATTAGNQDQAAIRK